MVVQMSILALDLVEAGSAFLTSQNMRVGYTFGFRAGLHYGPMSAGILGRSRRFYRIFGDTVVTAARMCQHTDYGTVQVSEKV
jgi:class 3 adenylate cyclase